MVLFRRSLPSGIAWALFVGALTSTIGVISPLAEEQSNLGHASHVADVDCAAKFEGLMLKVESLADELKGTPNYTSPRAWREKSAPFGLPGLDLPPDVGGQGYAATDMVKVFEQMGKRSLDMRDMIGGAHVRPLLASETPEIRSIIEDVAKGKAYMAIAITEKEAGSNMRAMASVSEKVDGGYLLTGEKMYNARFETATHVILFTRSPIQDSASTKLNAFVLPKDYPGLKYLKLEAHGLHGNSFGGVSFDHMFVPDKYRIGGEGEGGKIFRNHFLYWRLMQSAAAIGTGKGALEQAVQRLRTRQAFGGPIGRFTHFQQELAEHTAKLHMASLLVEQASKLMDAGKYDAATALVAMAKGEGVEYALGASDFAMRVFGAEGYSPTLTDLGQRVRDLQGLRVADGTTNIMRQEVVRHIYGEDLWDMAIGSMGKAAKATEISGRMEDYTAGAILKVRNERVQKPNALAAQGNYDDLVRPEGGGACPTIAAANLMQALGVMSGKSPIVNLDQMVRQTYKSVPALENGRLTNQQVLDVLDHYRNNYFPDVRFKTHIDFQRQLQTGVQPTGSRGWSDFDSGLLQPKPLEVKLVSYTVTDSKGKVLGRHFVILKDRTGDTVSVLDPNNPGKDYIYELRRVDLPDNSGSTFRLVRPGTPETGAMTFDINSVFSVALENP